MENKIPLDALILELISENVDPTLTSVIIQGKVREATVTLNIRKFLQVDTILEIPIKNSRVTRKGGKFTQTKKVVIHYGDTYRINVLCIKLSEFLKRKGKPAQDVLILVKNHSINKKGKNDPKLIAKLCISKGLTVPEIESYIKECNNWIDEYTRTINPKI